jgi:tRNA dimethylallyltransferase
MDIGTAKPTPAEQAAVRHHLLDLADPTEEFTVARFQRAFRAAIADVESRGRRALLVGGTGLYLRAAIDDLDIPGRFPVVRAGLEAERDTSALHARLASVDPAAAGRMEPTNRRRVVRALEVTLGSGRLFSSFGPGLGSYRPSRFALLGVWLPRQVVAERIARRYADQVAAGFVDEVRGLAATGLGRTARQALGYKELLAHLAGACTEEEAIDLAVRRTRRFARRQRVWFQRDPRITWVGAGDDPMVALGALHAEIGALDRA